LGITYISYAYIYTYKNTHTHTYRKNHIYTHVKKIQQNVTAILEICTFPKPYVIYVISFSTQNWPLERSETE